MPISEAARIALELINKQFLKFPLSTLSKAPRARIECFSTGSLILDQLFGGGWPKGRMVELFGRPHCLDRNTHISYHIVRSDGTKANFKGGSIERLYERFHGVIIGNGKGKNRNSQLNSCGFTAASVREDGTIVHNKIVDVVQSGIKECFKLATESGSIVASLDHKFLTPNGYIRLGDLQIGDSVLINNKTINPIYGNSGNKRAFVYTNHHPFASIKTINSVINRTTKERKAYSYRIIPRSRAVVEAGMNGLQLAEYITVLNSGEIGGLKFLQESQVVHHKNEDCSDDRPENLQILSDLEHKQLHSSTDGIRFIVQPTQVLSITPVGQRTTYDICMESPLNNFIANGFAVHNSGKTTLCLHAIAEVQKTGVCAFLDTEQRADLEYASKLGVDPDSLIFDQPKGGADAFDKVVKLLETKAFRLIVLDSLAHTKPKSIADGPLEAANIGTHAKLVGNALDRIGKVLGNCTVIFTNQIRKDPSGYGSGEFTPGGESPKFDCDLRVRLQAQAAQRDGEEMPTHNEVEAKVYKNSIGGIPHRSATFTIRFGQGVAQADDTLDSAILSGVIHAAQNGYHSIIHNETKTSIGRSREAALYWIQSRERIQTIRRLVKETDWFTGKEPVTKEEGDIVPLNSGTKEEPIPSDAVSNLQDHIRQQQDGASPSLRETEEIIKRGIKVIPGN